LTPETRQAFQSAATLPFIRRYYLAGDTGLALHLGHRFSAALDFLDRRSDSRASAEQILRHIGARDGYPPGQRVVARAEELAPCRADIAHRREWNTVHLTKSASALII